ncbi:MAG TPA: endolytic transglycosylase MltG, partial [Conexibacter sp.]|nr:endolytic transglycosylase MltG [Conexibacter sp.]
PAPAEAPLGTRRVGLHERQRGRGRRGGPPAPPRTRTAGPSGGARRWGGRVFALAAILLVVLAGWFLWSLYQPGAGEGSGRVAVTVPRGVGVGEIGDLLADRGVIDSSFFFGLRAKLSGSSGDLKSGTFTLRRDMSYGDALDRLTTTPPPPPVIRITIPEGRSRGEIAPLARQAGLRGDYRRASRGSPELDPRRYGAPRGATLEGFLFPATYELRRGATARQLVNQQLLAFRQNLAKVDLRYARSKNLTVFDVLTIASMVEREVAVARERPLVAAVIYNRLSDGMPLGIDATLRFELNDWTSPLLQSELTADTPYNTRTNAGLPPGPIGNPGLASLEAASRPARVDYLYYVVKPDTCGEHVFATSDAEAQQNVAEYEAAREAAGGKSPTRC